MRAAGRRRAAAAGQPAYRILLAPSALLKALLKGNELRRENQEGRKLGAARSWPGSR